MTELRSQLEAWCQSYVTAFSAYNAAAITQHWAFPAVIAQSGRRISFKSQDHFTKNTSLLLEFYKAQDVDRAKRSLLNMLPMDHSTASIIVEDEMLNCDGEIIVAWSAAYVLQRTELGWKAILALAEGEIAAWMARGTPLGVKR